MIAPGYPGLYDDSADDTSTVSRLIVDPATRAAHLALRNLNQLTAEFNHQKDRNLRMGGLLGKTPNQALHTINPANIDEFVSALMDLHAANDKLKDTLVSKAERRAFFRPLPMQCAKFFSGALVVAFVCAICVVAFHPLDN